jgi:hypothetical protein
VDTAVTQGTRKRWKDQGIEPITLHACRHTCASLLIAAGVPAKAVQSHLGHSSIRFFPSIESGDNMILATDYPLLEVFWTILIFVAFAVWIYLLSWCSPTSSVATTSQVGSRSYGSSLSS